MTITASEAGLTTAQYNNIIAGNFSGSTYKVVAHRFNPVFSQLHAGLTGTAPFYSCASSTKIFVAPASNHFHVYDIGTNTWSTGTSPWSAETKLYYAGTTLYAFAIDAGEIKVKTSTTNGSTWSSATTVVPVTSGHTITKFAVRNENRVHYILRDETKKVYQFRVATYTTSWANDGDKLYYPYPIDDIAVCADNVSNQDIVVVETEIPGPLSAEAEVDGRRYWEQVTALISFTYKVGTQDWGYHSEIDRCHKLNNPDDVLGVYAHNINGRIFVNTWRKRGVLSQTIQNHTEYMSWDGEFWSLGLVINLPEATNLAEYFLIGDYLYAFGREGKVWRSYSTAAYGFVPSAIKQDITSDVSDLSVQRAEMLSASFTIHNPNGDYNNHAFIRPENRIAYDIYVTYDDLEVKLGTVYQDAFETEYVYYGTSPSAMLRVVGRDEFSWMTDYYKSEDFRQSDPSIYAYYFYEQGFKESFAQMKDVVINSQNKTVFASVKGKCFPSLKVNLGTLQNVIAFYEDPSNFVFFQDNSIRQKVNSTVYTLVTISLNSNEFSTYYASIFYLNQYYPLYMTNLQALDGKYSVTETPAIAGRVAVLTNGYKNAEEYFTNTNVDVYVEEKKSGVTPKTFAKRYAAYARIKSNVLNSISLINLPSSGDNLPYDGYTATNFGPLDLTNNLYTPAQRSAVESTFSMPIGTAGSTYAFTRTISTIPQNMDFLFFAIEHKVSETLNASAQTEPRHIQCLGSFQTIYSPTAPESACYIVFTLLDNKKVYCAISGINHISIDKSIPNGTPQPIHTFPYLIKIPKGIKNKIKSIFIKITYQNLVANHNTSSPVVTSTPLTFKLLGGFRAKPFNFTNSIALTKQHEKFQINFTNPSSLTDYSTSILIGKVGKSKTIFNCITMGRTSDFKTVSVHPAKIFFSFKEDYIDSVKLYKSMIDNTVVRTDKYIPCNASTNINALRTTGPDKNGWDSGALFNGSLYLPKVFPSEVWFISIDTPLSYSVSFSDPGTDYNSTVEAVDMEYVTLDPGESPMGGLQRAIDGRYIKLFTRFNGDLVMHIWTNKSSAFTFLNSDHIDFKKAFDQRELHNHVRMLGAYTEGEYIDHDLVDQIGYRFTEANNPYLLTDRECYIEAKNHVRRMKENAETASFSYQFLNPFLEPEDRITVENEGDWIINGYDLEFSPGYVKATYSIRRWVDD